MSRFTIGLVFLVCVGHLSKCSLITEEQRLSHFLGCSIIEDCDMDEFFLGSAPATDREKVKDRYEPTDCVNFCKHFAPGVPMFSYAGVASKLCYCFDSVHRMKFLKTKDQRCEESCPDTASCKDSHLLYIYSVCEKGKFGSPSCDVDCPSYCAPMKIGQQYSGNSICDRHGRCSLGCKNDYCFSPTLCETVTGEGLPSTSDDPKIASLEKIEPNLIIYPNLCFETDGYVSRVEFYGRGQGSAYVSVWRPAGGNDTDWELQWKFKMYAGSEGSTTQTFQPDMSKPSEVHQGDCVGVHFDNSLMTQLDVDDRKEYTLLYAYPMDGYHMEQLDVWDAGWTPQDFTETDLRKRNMTYQPSLALSISCHCPATCHPDNCESSKCSECMPGFKGDLCDQPCMDGYYGKACSSACPPNCRKIMTEAENSTEMNMCDKVTGTCVAGCEPGFRGVHCDVQCSDGHWGVGCKDLCGACKANAACNKVTGECTDGCRAGFNGTMCQAPCGDGFYGEGCAAVCGKCKLGTCHPETGACQSGCQDSYQAPTCRCTGNKYGMDCDQDCGECANGDPCNDDNGECPYQCVDGKQPPMCQSPCNNGFWGPNCASPCGHCENGDTCNIQTGECATEKCGAGYRGKSCMTPCPGGFYGQDCASECKYCKTPVGDMQASCSNVHGDCIFGCQGGFLVPKCEVCAPLHYGPACLKCGNCKGAEQCSEDGTCPNGCDPGVYNSPGCTDICNPGMWGENCEQECGHCVQCGSCDPKTGACEKGCQAGYKAPDCIDKCPANKYGPQCDKDCGKCKDNAQCNPYGVCLEGCEGDYIPPSCQMTSCGAGLWGTRCTNLCGKCRGGVTCNLIEGSCPGACAEGYTGEFCTIKQPVVLGPSRDLQLQACDSGTWGDGCTKQCGNCKGNKDCDDKDGNCDECEDGYDPPMCVDRCTPGFFGPRCRFECGACKNEETCKDTDGSCLSGCADGYLPPACQSQCDDGWYGPGCQSQCHNCLGQCRQTDGTCLQGCQEGWQGDLCNIDVRGNQSAGQNTQYTFNMLTILFALGFCFLM